MNISNLTNDEIKDLVDKLNSIKYLRTIFPDFGSKCENTVVHNDDNINSLADFDTLSSVKTIDLDGAKLTPVFLSRCKFYFSQQFYRLVTMDLRNIKDVSKLIQAIFCDKNINKFPRLDELRR